MTPSIQQLTDAFVELFRRDPVPRPTDEPAVAALEGQPVLASPPAESCLAADYTSKGYHLDVTVSAHRVVAVAELLDQHGFGMDTITGVDWMAESQMEVVYDYFHVPSGLRVVVRSRIPRGNPEIGTISTIFPGANWHERETHDFFGIRFLGHPDLTPFLLPEDADYHPLRKDFNP